MIICSIIFVIKDIDSKLVQVDYRNRDLFSSNQNKNEKFEIESSPAKRESSLQLISFDKSNSHTRFICIIIRSL